MLLVNNPKAREKCLEKIFARVTTGGRSWLSPFRAGDGTDCRRLVGSRRSLLELPSVNLSSQPFPLPSSKGFILPGVTEAVPSESFQSNPIGLSLFSRCHEVQNSARNKFSSSTAGSFRGSSFCKGLSRTICKEAAPGT